MKNSIGLLFLIAVLMSCTAKRTNRIKDNRNVNEVEYSILGLSGTDALGRRSEVCSSTEKQTKYVGLFYSLWLGQHNRGVYDISRLLSDNPSALLNPDGEPESPLNQFHFWGEPLYGYYNMNDPWVVTRHIELLTHAAIDYLCIDATNTFIYPNPAKNLFEVLLKFQKQGFNVPKVVFYTNSRSGETVNRIYENFYKDGLYERLWFKPNGKPLMIGITENNANASDMTKFHSFTDYIIPEMIAYFDVRESQWPNGDFNPDAVPWMSWQYPQWNHNGSVAVPVAQHSHSVIYASSMHPECSRGYNNATGKVEKEWAAGANFQTMWDAVHEKKDSINNVLVTSFNEWMAIKYKNEANEVFFVDVYNPEFSRDIEMMKGGYNDNFYMQLVKNVRKFKFVEGSHYQYQNKTIDIHESPGEIWSNVQATYVDFAGDAISRDFVDAASTGRYTDYSNRNDIAKIKVVHDEKNIYFMIQTLDDITPYNGEDINWMNVLIRTGGGPPSFEGYQFVINRKPDKINTTSVERSTGGYHWEYAGDAYYSIEGNVLQLAIPLALLGLSKNNCSIEFKVADNVTRFNDIMDYYVTGDSAPLGRLNFSYGY
ncbi:hypothetical protein [uncultured Proteiniphilum sp.]|uniref:hypothetical protein n=1 Tax=uncultured Proteiniphilum sp. TaxID=497637 RepID=UPI002627453E|nr:hypothetical protein [uncultured Proteiniphilum sp.]